MSLIKFQKNHYFATKIDRSGRKQQPRRGEIDDFRSDEVKALRDEADVIVINPPFSLFREF